MVLPAFGRVRVHAHTPALQGLGQAVTCTHLSSAPTAVKCHGSLVPEGFYIPNFPKLQVFSTPVVSHRGVASPPVWPSTLGRCPGAQIRNAVQVPGQVN